MLYPYPPRRVSRRPLSGRGSAIGYRIGSATCQAFWYTAQRPGGLCLTRSIGSRPMATHTGLGSAGNLDEKARVVYEQAHSYDLA